MRPPGVRRSRAERLRWARRSAARAAEHAEHATWRGAYHGYVCALELLEPVCDAEVTVGDLAERCAPAY